MNAFGALELDDRPAMDALTAQLQAHGLVQGTFDPHNSKQVHEVLFLLLEAHAAGQTQREALGGRLRAQEYDIERATARVEAEASTRVAAERDAELERAKASAATKALSLESDKLKSTRDDLQKARAALRDVKTQAGQDQRRRERELTTTLQKWQKLASAPAVVTNGKLTLRAPLPAPSSSSDAHRGEVQLLEDSLTDLEASRSALLNENAELRDTFRLLDEELRVLLTSAGKEAPGATENLASLPASLLQQQLANLLTLLVENVNDRLEAYTVHQGHINEAQDEASKANDGLAEMQAKTENLEAELELAQEQARQDQAAIKDLQARCEALSAAAAAPKPAPAPISASSSRSALKRPAQEDLDAEAERLAHKERKRARKAAKAEAQAAEAAKITQAAQTPPREPSRPRSKPASSSALTSILALTASPVNVPSRKDRNKKPRT